MATPIKHASRGSYVGYRVDCPEEINVKTLLTIHDQNKVYSK